MILLLLFILISLRLNVKQMNSENANKYSKQQNLYQLEVLLFGIKNMLKICCEINILNKLSITICFTYRKLHFAMHPDFQLL